VAFWRSNFNRHGKLSALADLVFRAVSRHPFLTYCLIGFLSGSLLDLDHIPLRLFHVKYWVPIYIRGPYDLGQGRNLHGVALVGGRLMCACAGGSLLLMVLEEQARRVVIWIRSSAKSLTLDDNN